MRLLHTSDWHLGARLGRHDRQPDHLVAIKALLKVAEARKPDVILHTGDLFDSARPPYEALRLAVKALSRLAAVAPTIVLAGNHDSPALFAALHDLAGLAEPRRLWLVREPEVLRLPGLDKVAFACVPFLPATAVTNLATTDLARVQGTYADGVRDLSVGLLNEAEQVAGKRGIVVFAAHLHVHQARPGKSERRITVGDDFATHTDVLTRAMYAAFGHIHDPQLLPGGVVTGCYAGSLIPLDFGEVSQTKRSVVVELGNDVRTESVELPGGRALVEFSGTLDELQVRALSGQLEGTLLKARVISEEPLLDLADRLAQWSPGCYVFDLVNSVSHRSVKAILATEDGTAEPSIEDLFADWRDKVAHANARRAPDEEVIPLLREALDIRGGTGPALGGIPQLLADVQRALETLASLRRA